ncbi:hypothetical protein ACLMJK_007125 [Lecanora helva]
MIRRKPDTPQPSSYLSTPPPETSPRSSIVVSDWDADDEDSTSMEDVRASRPSSLDTSEDSIQQERPPYPQRPTLPDVLSNSAPPPWTLSAFTAYLSQMHCLENLEFTMDADRYRERYDAMSSQMAGTASTNEVEEHKYVTMLWERLINAYIIPDGPREINLPSDVRDTLLSLSNNNNMPPRPEMLDPAVKIIYNLMEESVLISFLNEIPSTKGRQSNHNRQKTLETKPRKRGGSDSSTEKRSGRSKSTRRASPSAFLDSRAEYSKGDPTGRLTPNASYSRVPRAQGYTSSGNGDTGSLTDDSTNAPSPGAEPMTPPNTPPSSDFGGHSPRSRNDNGWKKMLGWKKKSSTGMRDSRYPSFED